MAQPTTKLSKPKSADVTARNVVDRLNAGEDPRLAIATLNAQIVAFQGAGADLPANLMKLSQTITACYAAQEQGVRRV